MGSEELKAEGRQKRRQLSREILGLFGVTAIVAVSFFGFLIAAAKSVVASYCYRMDLVLGELQEWTLNSWIYSVSFVAAVIVFVVLFLFLVGQKIAYLTDIIKGIEALHTHRMDYQIPIEGNNEFTELAERINYLAKAERELQEKESQMKAEREDLIRALSHDIRTPLTAIMSYSEYMQQKVGAVDSKEFEEYVFLMKQKAGQIKTLTDRLLDGDRCSPEWIENGRFLMEQLVDEWSDLIGDTYTCEIDMSECGDFSGQFDIAELRRIFDNLASNVEKYADPGQPVWMSVSAAEGILRIKQGNTCNVYTEAVESYGIGIGSIRRIAANYDGEVDVSQDESRFKIVIRLRYAEHKSHMIG